MSLPSLTVITITASLCDGNDSLCDGNDCDGNDIFYYSGENAG